MEIGNYKDELKDFCLLYSNQLLLGIFVTELPLESYEVQVFTKHCEKEGTPLILNYYWYGGINTELGDTRRKFHFTTNIKEMTEDFRLDIYLNYSEMGDLENLAGCSQKSFMFHPTKNNGEAIVNETLIWIRNEMVKIMSGEN